MRRRAGAKVLADSLNTQSGTQWDGFRHVRRLEFTVVAALGYMPQTDKGDRDFGTSFGGGVRAS